MSRNSRVIWSLIAAGAVAAVTASTDAAGSDRSPFTWGYDAVPTTDYDCTTCMGAVEILHLGKGTYDVNIARINMDNPSNLQVSSSSPVPTYCTIVRWGPGSRKTIDAYVNCYDENNYPADTYFSFLYQSRKKPFGSANKGIAFLWADQPTNASYTPSLDYQYNSAGATNTMVRNGTGSYTAHIPDLTKQGGNVQVTAYANGPARCTLSGWSSDQSGTSANVLCFDATGAAADEMFTLTYSIGESLALFGGRTGGYVLADKSHERKVYTPSLAYNYNGFGTGPITAQKTAMGAYTLNVPDKTGLGSASIVLVTAISTSGTFCTAGDPLEEWYPIQILCYDHLGDQMDSEFSVSLQTDLPK